MTEPTRFPGYDVLQKRDGPSWNDATRRVIDRRLGLPLSPQFFSEAAWRVLGALCDRVVPQPPDREKVPLPSLVEDKIVNGRTDGYRLEGMPHMGEAWQRGLAALDEAARRDHGVDFAALEAAAQDAMLRALQQGEFRAEALRGMPPKTFFHARVIGDVALSYYTHPTAWNEIGWAGPASPRGYVRLSAGLRDPWEPAASDEVGAERARRENRRVR